MDERQGQLAYGCVSVPRFEGTNNELLGHCGLVPVPRSCLSHAEQAPFNAPHYAIKPAWVTLSETFHSLSFRSPR